MEFIKRGKEDISLVSETKIYEMMEAWLDESNRSELRKKITLAEGDYKKDLIKLYRKMDFFKTFILICDLSSQYINKFDDRFKFIKNVVGSVMGRLVFETSEIPELREVLKDLNKRDSEGLLEWINNRRHGKIWIEATKMEDIIKDLLLMDKEIRIAEIPDNWQMTFADYAKYEFALITGSSFNDVESMMARGISRTSLCNILYGYIMIRRLIESLGSNLYLTWHGDGNLFKGSSGIINFFDGIVLLDEDDKENPYLLKSVATCHNPLDVVESISSKLEDIGMNKCILFMPMYPSQNANRYCVHAYSEKHQEIIMLYLHDLYTILRMDNIDVCGYIKGEYL
jgi:hypothetical protein